jgi:putative integral membrane transport protein
MAQYSGMKGYADKAANYLTAGSSFGQIAVAVLGALLITGEYSSGQIRSSLAAVPRRGRLFAAKAVVVAIFSALLGLVTVALTYLFSLPILGDKAGSLSNPEYLGFFWGTALAFAIIGLMAMSFGYILRSTAGSISLVVVLLFVIQIPLGMASAKWSWAAYAMEILPSTSGAAAADPYNLIVTTKLDYDVVIAAGYAWAIIPMIIAYFVFSKRDA